MTAALTYRPEIDGLRALSVVPVILFHAGLEGFSGGFVGVDVFFVISGYLITSILAADLAQGRFSYRDFYERRARRILPALVLISLVSIPFAWLWLTPQDMEAYAKSLMGVATFSANFIFWQEAGYFDQASELKPLLHTWSLAVEEQYYILFPPLFAAIWGLGRGKIAVVFAVLALASLAAAELLVVRDQAAAFYLLPTRLWELMIGSLLALYLWRNDAPSGVLANLLGSAGIGMIVAAILLFDEATRFPSLYALLPTLGAALVILFAREGTVAHRLLSVKVMTLLGLMSYSLYLWHQPVFAYYRHATREETDPAALLFLIPLIFALSFLSWRYVERPFRSRQRVPARRIWQLSAGCLALLLATGAAVEGRDGFYPKGHVARLPAVPDAMPAVGGTMILGDSHAAHLHFGLEKVLRSDVINHWAPGCIPLQGMDRYDNRFLPGECRDKMAKGLELFLSSPDLKNLVISHMGPVYLDGTAFRGQKRDRVLGQVVTLEGRQDLDDPWEMMALAMRGTFERLSAHPEKNVIFMIDVPELGIRDCADTPGKELALPGITLRDLLTPPSPDRCRIPRAEFDARAARYHSMVQEIAADHPAITLIDPTPLFCDANWCHGHNETAGYLYSDVDHLSHAGSVYVALAILPLLD